jgi:ABC-type transport system involved in multi-copper enzyme maturation permease subunit
MLLGPIFNREFLTVPRRARHYVLRTAYLGSLWVVGLTAYQTMVGWTRAASLGETAHFGAVLFQLLTGLMLALFLFFSALSAASSVAREKDRRTFVLLLMTDLRNSEIVLGKILGSLLPIWLLLATTVPLLMFLLLLGGVSLQQVIQAVLVAAATSLAAASLGGLVALWRDRTFQSLALTVLLLVFYLCLARGAALLLGLIPALADQPVLACLDPFEALRAVHDPLASGFAPAYVFVGVMVVLSVMLNAWGVLRLRVWNPSGEPVQQREQPDEAAEAKERADIAALTALARRPSRELMRAAAGGSVATAVTTETAPLSTAANGPAAPPPETAKTERRTAHAAPGAARKVGANPILWREVYTRSYGRRPLLVKTAYFVVLALICYFALQPLWGSSRYAFAAAYGLAPVGVLSLLLIAAQSATSITSERDIGALDLLLVTDLTPKEFIFGKLGGVLWNTKEFIVPPLVLAVVYACWGLLAAPPAGHRELAASMNVTALVCVLAGLLVLTAFVMVLGLHVALRNQNSGAAVVLTLGTVFFLSLGTLFCLALIVLSGKFEYQWLSFLLFLAAGIGGLWWVLNGGRPSTALTWASWFCPLAVFYAVMNVVVARPGSQESADPLPPFLVIVAAFGFAIAAMLVPLLSEFDVALGRTTGGAD